MKRIRHKPLAQAGIASIMITMIMMIVISLIVLGFAEVSRREQRQSLDRQLTAEAYYAAESGVNDAVSALRLYPSDLQVADKTNCAPLSGDPNGALSVAASRIDPTNNVEYTCLLVDATPTSLQYSHTGIDDSQVVPLQSASGNFKQITISWQSAASVASGSGGTGFSCPGKGVFPKANSWPNNCDPGILRIDLVPMNSLSRAALTASDFAAFLQPQSGGAGTVANGASSDVMGGCSTSNTYYCQVTITGLDQNFYYLRMYSIYVDNAVNITGKTTNGNAAQFVGAQAKIDSTGKAQDELRRIQVYVSLANNSASGSGSSGPVVPGFAIQTEGSICKKFAVAPGINPINESTLSECSGNNTFN